jgi:hypothetical protein
MFLPFIIIIIIIIIIISKTRESIEVGLCLYAVPETTRRRERL